MNAGTKAVLGGVVVGLVFATLCAIFFGVWRGDEAYNSPTLKITLGVSIFVSAFTSAKLALASAQLNDDDRTNE